jgi:hypothetical protein
MSQYKVKFTDLINKSDHIEYLITLTDVHSGHTYEFTRRYSVLRNSFELLKQSSLRFPPKKFFGNKNIKFLQRRKNDLEVFFSSAFSDLRLSKVLLASPCFSLPDPVKIDVKKETYEKSTKNENQGLCKGCIRDFCWETSHERCEKMIDLSCHPGSWTESEIGEVKNGILEKCKDLKIGEVYCEGDRDDEGIEGRVTGTTWISSAFQKCFDIIDP